MNVTPSLYIHIGPYKTGTTSFQNYMWKNRKKYKKVGLIYPSSGIVVNSRGPRHLKLSRNPASIEGKQKLDAAWTDLFNEIKDLDNGEKVIISAERFSLSMNQLVERKKQLEPYNPKLVIVIREELALSRSMYFKCVTRRFGRKEEKQAAGLKNFDKWFDSYKSNLSYAQILQPWVDSFGIESVIFVPYQKTRKSNIITNLLRAIDAPSIISFKKSNRSNPSIGWLATTAAIIESKHNPVRAQQAMILGSKIEKKYPYMKDIPPGCYSPKKMQAYFISENALALKKYPQFKQAYDLACQPENGFLKNRFFKFLNWF
jgi:hypothetical protein